MSPTKIRALNASGTFLFFLACTWISISKLVRGEELFLRHYMLIYFGFFCLAVCVVSLARIRNDRLG